MGDSFLDRTVLGLSADRIASTVMTRSHMMIRDWTVSLINLPRY